MLIPQKFHLTLRNLYLLTKLRNTIYKKKNFKIRLNSGECLLSIAAESSVLQFDIQKYKD
jgi:hypothetical protein